MATENASHHCRTYYAGADLSAKQYYAAKLSTAAEQTVLLCDSSEQFIGVLESTGKPQSGFLSPGATIESRTVPNNCSVVIGVGVMTKGLAGGALTLGQAVKVNGSGKFVAASVGDMAIGRAESAAAIDGDIFQLLITGKWVVVAG